MVEQWPFKPHDAGSTPAAPSSTGWTQNGHLHLILNQDEVSSSLTHPIGDPLIGRRADSDPANAGSIPAPRTWLVEN